MQTDLCKFHGSSVPCVHAVETVMILDHREVEVCGFHAAIVRVARRRSIESEAS